MHYYVKVGTIIPVGRSAVRAKESTGYCFSSLTKNSCSSTEHIPVSANSSSSQRRPFCWSVPVLVTAHPNQQQWHVFIRQASVGVSNDICGSVSHQLPNTIREWLSSFESSQGELNKWHRWQFLQPVPRRDRGPSAFCTELVSPAPAPVTHAGKNTEKRHNVQMQIPMSLYLWNPTALWLALLSGLLLPLWTLLSTTH